MKYAVISDVHGNLDALEAVLSDAARQLADVYLFTGDYCLSLPFPEQVVRRIAGLKHACVIRGNEEQYIERMQGEDEARWEGGQMHISCWCAHALSGESRRFLRGLPEKMSFRDEESDVVFHMAHSSHDWLRDAELGKFSCPTIPLMYGEGELKHRRLLEDIRSHLRVNQEFQEQCEKLEDGVYLFGHSHIQWFMQSGKKVFINPGSCGLPMDSCEQGAPYTLITAGKGGISVEERRVPYDIEGFIKKLRKSDQYKRVPVWSQIRIRELRTRREHLYYFLEYTERYARRVGDPVRPFTRNTWEGAYEEWTER